MALYDDSNVIFLEGGGGVDSFFVLGQSRTGVAAIVNREPEAIRARQNIHYVCIFSLSLISSESFLGPQALWHSRFSLLTRDKQIFHKKSF